MLNKEEALDYKDKLDRLNAYYNDHSGDIEESEPGGGSNYIFKLLWKTLKQNSIAMSITRTIPTATIAQEVAREHDLLELGQKRIVEALCELIGQDYDYRLREYEDDADYYRREMDDWKEIANNYEDRYNEE